MTHQTNTVLELPGGGTLERRVPKPLSTKGEEARRARARDRKLAKQFAKEAKNPTWTLEMIRQYLRDVAESSQ